MTIEEAIQHCKEVVTENRRCALEFSRAKVYDAARNCQKCAAEHVQLAEWLTELKQRREAEIGENPKSNGDRIRQMTDEELAEIMRSCNFCAYLDKGCQHNGTCTQGFLEWLKQEVETDAADN